MPPQTPSSTPTPEPTPPLKDEELVLPPHAETLDKMDPDEHLVALIRRHPFGIIILYIQAGIGVAALLALVYFLLPDFTDSISDSTLQLIKNGGLAVLVLLILILILATFVYRLSHLTVTDKTITQVLQEGLINRKVSQLAITDIEDVTADRRGFFATIFNFGTLFIETAGEKENFEFKYCPNPNHYAKLILEYRQHYIHNHP